MTGHQVQYGQYGRDTHTWANWTSSLPRACVRVYVRVLVPPNLDIHTYIHTYPATVSQITATIYVHTDDHGHTHKNHIHDTTQTKRDLRPPRVNPEAAHASVNAGVDSFCCVRHLAGGFRGLPRLGEGRASDSEPSGGKSTLSSEKWTTPILRAATTTSTIKRRCAPLLALCSCECASVGGVFSVGVSCVRVTC